jgi:selenocysteine lyase/cysteine desulfurase
LPLPNQRHHFDIPAEVTYLNCAYLSPLMHGVMASGETGLARKRHPWTIRREDFYQPVEEARERFARLVGAAADDVAIVPSSSYGAAVASANLPLERAQNIVHLADEHASNTLEWLCRAGAVGAGVRTVERPAGGDWTSAVLERIDSGTALAALPNLHWTDGGLLDLVAIGRRCREVGAALVVDGTQSIGAMPFDVQAVQPDFLLCSAYKWLLCPYTLAFLYAAPHRQAGQPIEHHSFSRAGAETSEGRTAYVFEFQPGARRYDMGERSNFVSLPMAVTAIDQLLAWTPAEIAATLEPLTLRAAELAETRGFAVPPAGHRAPHMIGIRAGDRFDVGLARELATRGVEVSLRGDALRVSPHLYNDQAHIERLFEELDRIV